MINYAFPVLIVMLFISQSVSYAGDDSLAEFHSLVRRENWHETWLNKEGKSQSLLVRGEIWTEAFQAALTKNKVLHIPARNQPYYLDAPLILESGDTIKADVTAEIRLKPGCNTCMVRNENIVSFAEKPVPKDLKPDKDILIEGGIWTTLATGDKKANGNMRGFSSRKNYVPGTHGVILLHNVKNVIVRNITVRQSKAFAVHLGNARDFEINGITLDRQQRDGVHVNGPSSHGVIRNVSGDSHDDTVALNAWEWKNYTPSFGPIHHVLIENVSGSESGRASADSIRLLPGVKQFSDGTMIDCSIHDIELRNISNVREYKLYDQPNLEMGRDKDFSVHTGALKDIRIDQISFRRPGVIQIAAMVNGLTVENVDLFFAPAKNYKLIEIGPMSMTWRSGADPSRWVEVFSPNRDIRVKNFHLDKVRINGQVVHQAEERFLQVKDQKINPDYPATTPQGGTGKATLVR